MGGIHNITNRMGDVILALGEAEKANVQPTRIQLQKFIYLSDVLGQVVGTLKLREGHKTYRNGPYDAAIQNAVDSLAFRGVVRITGVWKTASGGTGTKYALAVPGQKLIHRLRESPAFARKVQVAKLVGAELCEFGWSRIVNLVYAEPTFVATRPSGWGSHLSPEDGLVVSTAFVLAIMRRTVGTLYPDREATPEWIAERFFAYLDDYDKNYALRIGAMET
jgi:hypothetical protein